jgi:hypothetical protein
MQAAIEQIYGGDLVYTIAQSADTYYIAMGEDNEGDIKALIDQNASASPTGETKAAIDLLQKTPYNEFVCSVNVVKLMTGLGGMMQNMGPMMQAGCGEDATPSPMPDIFGGLNVPSQSSLAIGGKVADGQSSVRLILPKQHHANPAKDDAATEPAKHSRPGNIKLIAINNKKSSLLSSTEGTFFDTMSSWPQPISVLKRRIF